MMKILVSTKISTLCFYGNIDKNINIDGNLCRIHEVHGYLHKIMQVDHQTLRNTKILNIFKHLFNFLTKLVYLLEIYII